MNRIDLIQELIMTGQRENHEDHIRLEQKLIEMESQVTSIRLWRAKVIGISAAISCALSAGSVILGHFIAVYLR